MLHCVESERECFEVVNMHNIWLLSLQNISDNFVRVRVKNVKKIPEWLYCRGFRWSIWDCIDI